MTLPRTIHRREARKRARARRSRPGDGHAFVTPSWLIAEMLATLVRQHSIVDDVVAYTADEDIPRGRTIMVRMPKRFMGGGL